MIFPPQKPERRAQERDEQAIQRWLERDWPRIKRRARRRNAHLVFIDETGFLLTPLVVRTWARRGQTPILHDRMRHRRKLSAIGAVTLSPRRRQANWYMHLSDQNIDQWDVIGFLRDLQRHLRGDIIVIWDGLAAHRSAAVRDYIAQHRRLIVERFPPYAPELNPQEYVWSHLKRTDLANLCPQNTDELSDHVCAAARALRPRRDLLHSFIRAAGLPIRL